MLAKSRIVTPVAAALLVAPLSLAAQWRAMPDTALQRHLTERVAHGLAVGLVAGMMESGAPRVATVALDRRTILEIGSVSKVFTTTLLAEMVGRGEVRLEDPVQRYLPTGVRMPTRSGKEITLLDLATSTSGLPRVPALEPPDSTNPYAAFGARDLYAYLTDYTLTRDPGATYEYSNLGMGLLGHVLALRAGTSYERLVTERILEPLGMRDTRIVLRAEDRRRFAGGHTVDLEPARAWDFDVLAGAGGWRSTADDMLRFLGAMVSPPDTPLGRALRLATDARRPTGMPNMSIGLGWHVIERGDRRIVWHNGETGGYHSFIGFDPTTGANALLLSNTAVDNDDLGFHLIDSRAPLRALPPTRTVVAVDSLALQRLVGMYELAPNVTITVTRRGVALSAQVTGQQAFRIFALSPTRFFYRVVEAELQFESDSTGAVTGLVLHQGGAAMPGKKVR